MMTKQKKLLEHHQCIYCMENKPLAEFNKDHVIPESFGKFGKKTPTLIGYVCRMCNQYLGDTVENDFGRDSLYGVIYRSASGIISAKEFYHQKKHKKILSAPYIRNDVYGDMLVDIGDFDPSKVPKLRVIIANQVIFMNSTKGVQAHYLIDRIPHRRFLEDIGLKPCYRYISFYLSAENTVVLYNQLEDSLKKSDIHVKLSTSGISEIDLRKGNQYLQFHSVLNDSVLRAIAKIAFNYFAYHYHSAAYSDSFNIIRNYIRKGIIPGYYVVKPRLDEEVDDLNQRNDYGHLILIQQMKENSIIARVSLFNEHIFRVILSKRYPIAIPRIGSYFDVTKKIIKSIP